MTRMNEEPHSRTSRSVMLLFSVALICRLASVSLVSLDSPSLVRMTTLAFYATFFILEVVWFVRFVRRRANWIESGMALVLTLVYLISEHIWRTGPW